MKIIQFIHPGKEHGKKSGTQWWTGTHMRKYMKVSGSFVNGINENIQNTDELYFWGEWESESYKETIKSGIENGPKYIFSPYYRLPFVENAANTDPFMFGNQFYYCFCKQGHYTSLRNLNNGDVMLFGSAKNKKFVLDSVVVIKKAISYKLKLSNIKAKKFNQVFFDVSLLPLVKHTKCVDPKKIIQKGRCYKFSEKEDNRKYSCKRHF